MTSQQDLLAAYLHNFTAAELYRAGRRLLRAIKQLLRVFYMCIIKLINVVNVRNVNQASYVNQANNVNYIVKILAFEAQLINYNCSLFIP